MSETYYVIKFDAGDVSAVGSGNSSYVVSGGLVLSAWSPTGRWTRDRPSPPIGRVLCEFRDLREAITEARALEAVDGVLSS